jgi:hypothetical protein
LLSRQEADGRMAEVLQAGTVQAHVALSADEVADVNAAAARTSDRYNDLHTGLIGR